MRVIVPVGVTDTGAGTGVEYVGYTGIDLSSYGEWLVGTTYAAEDRVYHSGREYESLQDSNVGNTPADEPTWWLDIGQVNKDRMFDEQLVNPAVGQTATPVVLSMLINERIDGIAVHEAVCNTIRLKVIDNSEVTIYDETITMANEDFVYDYLTYANQGEVYALRSDVMFLSLAGLSGYSLEITFDAGPEAVSIGEINVGNVFVIGEAVDDSETGVEDYSVIEQDAFNTVIVQRGFARTVLFQLSVSTEEGRRNAKLLGALRGTRCSWFVDENTSQFGTTVYGVCSRWKTKLRASPKSNATLEILGMIQS